MKRALLITLLLSLLPILAHSQNGNWMDRNFEFSDKKELYSIIDSLISGAKYQYLFKSEEVKGNCDNGYCNTVITYESQENTNDIITINLFTIYEGFNKDLEIKGTPKHSLKYISGRFLDLYPFWEKYIDSNADKTSIATKGVKYILNNGKRYLFTNSGSPWRITVYDMP